MSKNKKLNVSGRINQEDGNQNQKELTDTNFDGSSKSNFTVYLGEKIQEYINDLTYFLDQKKGPHTKGDTVKKAVELLVKEYGKVPKRPKKIIKKERERGKRISEGHKARRDGIDYDNLGL